MPRGIEVHFWLEVLAYAIGAAWYRRNLRLTAASAPRPATMQSWAIVAGAIFGAAVGSKLLYVVQYLPALRGLPPVMWMSGKTLVGGLLGGLVGVELAKRAVNWRESTGDAFVAPLWVATLIGRIGCQLAGLADLTYGSPTTLPWGWNYGEGWLRHPVALYEALFLCVLAVALQRQRRWYQRRGDRFRLFMMAYLGFRLLIDFLKPPHGAAAAGYLAPALYGPLSAIQWACVAGLAYCLPTLRRWQQAGRY